MAPIQRIVSRADLEQIRFRDRREAGQALARMLEHHRGKDLVVLALPRGGVPVGYEVAQALQAPLDVFIVRKLGVPGHEELAMGAIASGGVRDINNDVVASLGISDKVIDRVTELETEELMRREQQYRGQRPMPDVAGRTVILVDDGLATGASMRAAVASLKRMEPAEIVVAVPAGAASTCESLREEVADVVCAIQPEPFYGVGMWYEDFSQTTDEEVREILHRNEY